jgi:hypothetical protein
MNFHTPHALASLALSVEFCCLIRSTKILIQSLRVINAGLIWNDKNSSRVVTGYSQAI